MNQIKGFAVLLLFASFVSRLEGALMDTFTFSGINATIPDGNAAGLANFQTTVSTSGMLEITSMTLDLNISGGFNGDLYVYLQHGNQISVLLNRVGRTSNDGTTAGAYGYDNTGFHITLSDLGSFNVHEYQGHSPIYDGSGRLTGTWQPDARTTDPGSVLQTDAPSASANLSAFNNLNPNGGWTLFLADLQSGQAATLDSWSMTITGVPEPANVALAIFGGLMVGGYLTRIAWRTKSKSKDKV